MVNLLDLTCEGHGDLLCFERSRRLFLVEMIFNIDFRLPKRVTQSNVMERRRMYYYL